MCFPEEGVVPEEYRDGGYGSTSDGDEHQARNAKGVAIYILEDDWVGFEVHVEDSIGKREVETSCQYDEFEEEHAKWSG